MNSDGSNEQQVTDTPALDALPAYSPNGKSIVFESDRGAKNNRDLYVTDVRGGDEHRLFADSRLLGCRTQLERELGQRQVHDHRNDPRRHDRWHVGNDVICGGGGSDTLLAGPATTSSTRETAGTTWSRAARPRRRPSRPQARHRDGSRGEAVSLAEGQAKAREL